MGDPLSPETRKKLVRLMAKIILKHEAAEREKANQGMQLPDKGLKNEHLRRRTP